VVTGGGSQLQHLKQLVDYTTGMQTRIGFPTEHIAKGTRDDLKNPMYATGIGLIIKGYEELAEAEAKNKKKTPQVVIEEPTQQEPQQPIAETPKTEERKTIKLPYAEKDSKWWTKLTGDIKEWFADTDVNKDFE